MLRIFADHIRVNPLNLRHPRSILPSHLQLVAQTLKLRGYEFQSAYQ